MASGQIMQILGVVQPAADYAEQDTITGGSTPAEIVDVYDFDPGSTNEHLDVYFKLDSYAGGGLTVTGDWTSEATSGNAIIGAAIRRTDSAITASHTYDFNDQAAQATNATARIPTEFTVTFTDGADMDSLADGEVGILRLRRNSNAAGDTLNSNDLELWINSITIKET